jgi:hypothetical protein
MGDDLTIVRFDPAERQAATESGIARRLTQIDADTEEKVFICVHLRDLRANAFLCQFAAVQQLRQLAA